MLVDAEILTDVVRGVPGATSYLQDLERGAVVAISAVTVTELLIGYCNKAGQRKIERFVRRFRETKLAEFIYGRAVSLLQRYLLSHGLLIAATALVLDEPLATKKRRDYRFVAGLRLLPYPEVVAVQRTSLLLI